MAKDNTAEKNWEMKPQTEIKHDLLTEYLKRWTPILGRSQNEQRVLHYIDGFAGRGTYNSGEEGSPFRAMQILHRVNSEVNLEPGQKPI